MLSLKHMPTAKQCQVSLLLFARDRDNFWNEMTKKKDKDPNAVALGRKGGKARRNKLTPERRTEIASKAAKARWSGERQGGEEPG